jgi:hypothetical protein
MHPIVDWTCCPNPGIVSGFEEPEWLEKWAPRCPDANPQRLGQILGFRLKAVDCLQLRVVLYPSDGGVCQGIVDERPDCVYVRLLVCLDLDRERHRRADSSDRFGTDCPCRVWLDAPLGERAVIDIDTDEELPLFIPRWGDPNARSEYVPRPPGDVWRYQYPEESDGSTDPEARTG